MSKRRGRLRRLMGARLRSPSGATSTVSRWLTAEFLEGLDARVVTGRCLSYGEGITYWLVVEVVKQPAMSASD